MTAPLRTRQIPTATTAPRRSSATATAAAPRFAPQSEPPRRQRAVPSTPPALRLVDPAAERQRRRTRALTGALIVAICAGLFTILALRVLLAQGQVEVDRLEATVTGQLAAQQRLRLTVAELEAPTRIVSAARTRLGMVNPGVVRTLTPPPATAR